MFKVKHKCGEKIVEVYDVKTEVPFGKDEIYFLIYDNFLKKWKWEREFLFIPIIQEESR